ncbi:DUF6292 family protein [Lentzea sp. BCCO 10_0856]|uniref:DUF6292 family protein n=1 Tax=Lentzea miocenica TaxID=3095431 RepID=A0ABU4STD3_9PSEU|nr:DUF6292 family protein [Lentzea sp. BCCO 10_0856]MDX8029167.1 DUF6292 family protein [Lentzea sp. BCCO 10_0856]
MDRDSTIDFDIDLDIDFDDSVARGVRRYVGDVVAGLGLRGDSSFVEVEPHAGAYVALDGRLPDFPDHDVALVWDERSGWSAAVEDRFGELVEVARLGGDPHAAPAAVVSWVQGLLHTEQAERVSNRDFAAFVPSPRGNDFS